MEALRDARLDRGGDRGGSGGDLFEEAIVRPSDTPSVAANVAQTRACLLLLFPTLHAGNFTLLPLSLFLVYCSDTSPDIALQTEHLTC